MKEQGKKEGTPKGQHGSQVHSHEGCPAIAKGVQMEQRQVFMGNVAGKTTK